MTCICLFLRKENPMNLGFKMGKNVERKFSDGNSGQLNTAGNINTITSGSSASIQITATLIGYYKQKERQNYTILALNKNSQNAKNIKFNFYKSKDSNLRENKNNSENVKYRGLTFTGNIKIIKQND